MIFQRCFLSWFGGARGIKEISGSIVLLNPITILCIILFVVGLWYPFKKDRNWISLVAILGIIGVKIYEFIFWHYMTMTGKVSLSLSLQLTYPEFYFSLAVSFIILFLYIFMNNKKHKLAM
ncbi:hypothetical protein SYNTR_0199 [Candidatus Syntrophocurvum alkaliphilum]|uniref:Prolipoprotein diacylglyceryl transferase n=1 Tax=Candidatus Syntrophocurvum alkaliphilum TaxID=2293317 RepID=A0A6I6DD80_9FIRM|nr:hypothetical protein [Candidatus Syntrophocurvum alkaliphilum]QGT98792.1 hypothetical protein SYNTR_0199 [Candidatus Syntrophocurvum alkaliphilum]